jgi:hypothetical protein
VRPRRSGTAVARSWSIFPTARGSTASSTESRTPGSAPPRHSCGSRRMRTPRSHDPRPPTSCSASATSSRRRRSRSTCSTACSSPTPMPAMPTWRSSTATTTAHASRATARSASRCRTAGASCRSRSAIPRTRASARTPSSGCPDATTPSRSCVVTPPRCASPPARRRCSNSRTTWSPHPVGRCD